MGAAALCREQCPVSYFTGGAGAEFSVESACAQHPAPERRLQLVYGHPVVLDETFVNPTCFADTSYRASGWGWQYLGDTQGFVRQHHWYCTTYKVPSEPTIRRVLQQVDADEVCHRE